jgi:hypothetical protein
MSAHNAVDAERTAEEPRRSLRRIDLRRLSRVALLGAGGGSRLPDAIEHLIKVHRGRHPGAGAAAVEQLRKAYVLAESSHRGQTRKSGEPYITHPLAVTLILAELGAETTTLTASLLHDTVEDTEVTLDQVESEFGAEVSYLVDGVTKLEKVDYGAAAEPETFRKMLVATGNDVRVMSIKLADRLHNMRTLGVMRPDKQARIAKVTRDVLIPLAERLGVQALKSELEDLVFAILHPEEYARTRAMIEEHAAAPDPLAGIAENLRGVLRDAGITAEVAIRPRHTVSVHRLLLKRGTTRLSGCDFGRLLVLVGENADCYAVLGELHTCFIPVIAEFKDFIAAPKVNLYQSLHTAIADRDGRIAEVLVRTRRMHRVAEAGVIALGDPHAAAEAAQLAEAERGETATGHVHGTAGAGGAVPGGGNGSLPGNGDGSAPGDAGGAGTASPRPVSSRSATRTPPRRPHSSPNATARSVPTRPAPAGSPACWTGSVPRPTRTPSGAPCARTSPRTARSPWSPHGARRRPAPSASRRVRAAWTPPTRCTARPGTPAWAPVSTAGSRRSAPGCATATPSSCSWTTAPRPGPTGTGWSTPPRPRRGSRSPAGSASTRRGRRTTGRKRPARSAPHPWPAPRPPPNRWRSRTCRMRRCGWPVAARRCRRTGSSGSPSAAAPSPCTGSSARTPCG